MYRLNSLNGRLILQIIGCCEISADSSMIGRRKEIRRTICDGFLNWKIINIQRGGFAIIYLSE
jgi:hypothetical protein